MVLVNASLGSRALLSLLSLSQGPPVPPSVPGACRRVGDTQGYSYALWDRQAWHFVVQETQQDDLRSELNAATNSYLLLERFSVWHVYII